MKSQQIETAGIVIFGALAVWFFYRAWRDAELRAASDRYAAENAARIDRNRANATPFSPIQ